MFDRFMSRVSLGEFTWIFLISCLIFQGVLQGSSYFRHKQISKEMQEALKLRASLDLASYEIAGEFQVPDEESRASYVNQLNLYMEEQGWPLVIEKITFLKPELPKSREVLALPSGAYIVYQNKSLAWNLSASFLPFVLAFLFSGVVVVLQPRVDVKEADINAEKSKAQDEEENPVVLKIDLEKRQLTHVRSGKISELANKPLCFYLALIQFCGERPDVFLNQNRDVPPELLALCEKYFRRLSELGHTVRKWPDFNKNLEKTLSEIRASLDEIFIDDPEHKNLLYPRKAIGEGSRSKVHNYAPSGLKQAQILICGL